MAIIHCVCVDGIQVGPALDTVDEAETAMSHLAMDGISGRSISVETYDQHEDGSVDEAYPFYLRGRWHHQLPLAA